MYLYIQMIPQSFSIEGDTGVPLETISVWKINRFRNCNVFYIKIIVSVSFNKSNKNMFCHRHLPVS